MRRWAWVAIGIVVSAGCGAPASGVREAAEDVHLELQSDGGVTARETWTPTFVSPDVTAFVREIPRDSVDAVTRIVASIDGRVLTAGDGINQVRVTNGDLVVVTWTFPRGQTSHVFGLTYVATGALSVDESHGSLVWRLLPPRRDYPISAAHVQLDVAPGPTFTGQAGINPDRHWTLRRVAGHLEADKIEVPTTDQVSLVAEFVIDPTVIGQPQWQVTAQETSFLMPAFIAGGLILIATGAGVMWMVRWHYPATGTLDLERATAFRALRISGATFVGLGIAGLGLTPLVLGRFGHWPLCLPASVIVVGAAFWLQGRSRPRPADLRKT